MANGAIRKCRRFAFVRRLVASRSVDDLEVIRSSADIVVIPVGIGPALRSIRRKEKPGMKCATILVTISAPAAAGG